MPVAIVGFDFGTHSTKIVYRLRDEDPLTKARVIRIDNGAANGMQRDPATVYPSFAVPSRIGQVDGCIRFGYGTLNPMLDCGPPIKMRLWEEECVIPALPDRDRAQREQERKERIKRYGNPKELCVAFLAWAFRRVRDEVQTTFPDATFQFYMPAPMDHYNQDGQVKAVFLKVMAAAWQLSFGDAYNALDLSNGAECQQVADAVRQALARVATHGVPGPEDRPYDVLPESLLPLVTLMHDPRFAPGYYLIVDCGGGSTEISVAFRYDGGNAVSCYEDVTLPGGSYRFRHALAQENSPELINQLISELAMNSRAVVFQAYRKVSGIPAAAEQFRQCLRILMLGGGMLLKDSRGSRFVEESFYRDGDLSFYRNGNTELLQFLAGQEIEEATLDRETLEAVANELGVPEGEARFLMLARGLAVGPGQLPTLFSPAAIEPFPRPELIERWPHWWQ